MKLVTSSLRRSASDALPPQVKSLNYLTSVLASIEARRQGADEAVLLNAQGLIAECTADNLFLVSRGRVLTPSVASGALAGITRSLVLHLLDEQGIEAAEAPLTPADAWTADELFLTGTGAEIVPVCEIDGRALPAERAGHRARARRLRGLHRRGERAGGRRRGVRGQHLIAARADADEADGDAEPLGDERDVALRGRREILEVARAVDRLAPALERLPDRLGVVEVGLVRREVLADRAVAQAVGDAHGDLRRAGEHVELRQHELGEAVDARGVAQPDEVEPAAAPRAAR